MLYNLAKSILFRMDPETAHHLTVDGLGKAPRIPGALALLKKLYGTEEHAELASEHWGLHFPNPIGLAAGLDKNGVAVPGFSAIGFGFLEVGTVTPLPQPGNDKPRLFRLIEDDALINRMGFNNSGTQSMAEQLMRSYGSRTIPVAVNIGKNKTTPNEIAEEDYRTCIRDLYEYADFFVVNISSPNTPDLRKLQHGEELARLLAAVADEVALQSSAHHAANDREGAVSASKAILVKIAPDVTDDELSLLVETIKHSGAAGIIATNTTIGRDGLMSVHAKEQGGLSGKPLTRRSTEIIRQVYRQTEGRMPIIGCGGIFSAQDAYEKIRAGASLVEVYTALIYRGPGLLREMNDGLLNLLQKDGYSHISEAVGADVT